MAKPKPVQKKSKPVQRKSAQQKVSRVSKKKQNPKTKKQLQTQRQAPKQPGGITRKKLSKSLSSSSPNFSAAASERSLVSAPGLSNNVIKGNVH